MHHSQCNVLAINFCDKEFWVMPLASIMPVALQYVQCIWYGSKTIHNIDNLQSPTSLSLPGKCTFTESFLVPSTPTNENYPLNFCVKFHVLWVSETLQRLIEEIELQQSDWFLIQHSKYEKTESLTNSLHRKG